MDYRNMSDHYFGSFVLDEGDFVAHVYGKWLKIESVPR